MTTRSAPSHAAALLLAVAAGGCGGASGGAPASRADAAADIDMAEPPDVEGDAGTDIRPRPDRPYLPEVGALPSAEIYDPERLPRFDITVGAAEIEVLNADVACRQGKTDAGPCPPAPYVEARFAYGAEVLARVGLRIKGEASLRSFAQKPAFKIKFDELVEGQAFRGLKRMTLNNGAEDHSLISERLTYHVFRELGLPAPRANNALVFVNGEFFGVYANIETEDKAFLRNWFSDTSGNLYEETGVDFLPGNEAAFEIETNESANDRSDLTGLINAVDTARDQTLLSNIGGWLEPSHFLDFVAAEALVNDWDMYAYAFCHVNNMRLYFDPSRGKFSFIPWGTDITLKPSFESGQYHLNAFVSPVPVNSWCLGKGGGGVIFRRCLRSKDCVDRYKETLAGAIDWFEQASLDSLAEHHYLQIKDQVYADTRKEITNKDFEDGYRAVRQMIRSTPALLRTQIQRYRMVDPDAGADADPDAGADASPDADTGGQ